jgi:SecD/SecF fusion protein
MNVTLEVGMADLIRSLSGYSKDKAFNEALNKAVQQKATTGKDLIDLFVENYHAAAPGNKLAPLFASGSSKRINFDASDDATVAYLRRESDVAFQNTYNILQNRIDRFGVASPTINPDNTKKIITVELAGVTDKDRVRKYLQSSANLQFFELYNINEIGQSLLNGEKALSIVQKGGVVNDSTLSDTSAVAKNDTSAAAMAKQAPIRSLFAQIFQPEQDKATGKISYPAALGLVLSKDTAILGEYLRNPVVASQFPSNLKFAYGYFGSGENEKNSGVFAIYALKTVDGMRAKLEGDRITDAGQDFDERGRVAIKMNMDNQGAKIWAKMTGDNVGKGIAIVLDDFVYSAPNVNGPIPNGSSEITGNYEIKEAQDMAEMLKSGKLPAPAKIVQEQIVGPTLGAEAVHGGSLAFTISFIVIFAFMLIYYNSSGWIANISLILNLLFTISILTAMGAHLYRCRYGRFGFSPSVWCGSNVIILKRIKEELTRGRNSPNSCCKRLSPLSCHLYLMRTLTSIPYGCILYILD